RFSRDWSSDVCSSDLYVEDLVDAFLACRERMPALRGGAFNMGGGPANAVSLLEVLERIGELTGRSPDIRHSDWRTGDQRYYVSRSEERRVGKEDSAAR